MKASTGLVLSITIANIGSSLPVYAQNTQSNNKEWALEEVVVTATKRETNLMDTSIAITAFTQDSLKRQGINDATQISKLVPNLDIGMSGAESGVAINIRGVTSNNFTEFGDPSVALHVDGIYSPRPQGALALLYDLERLEISRGPQGTLAGRNASGGSINIITAKPNRQEFSASIDTEIGNYNQRQITSMINIPVAETFALRANFMKEQRDSWVKQKADVRDQNGDGIADVDQRFNELGLDKDKFYGASNRWGARISGLWTPTQALDIRLSWENYQDKSPGQAGFADCEKALGACEKDTVYINVPGKLDMQIESVRFNLNYQVTDTLRVIYNYGQASQERYQVWDEDQGLRYPVNNPYGALVDTSAVGDVPAGYDRKKTMWNDQMLRTRWSEFDSYSHEIRLESTDSESPLEWSVGLYRFREDNGVHFDVDQPYCCDNQTSGAGAYIQPSRRMYSDARFGQLTWHANTQLSFTLGYRYSDETKEDVGGRSWNAWGPWSPGASPTGGDFADSGEGTALTNETGAPGDIGWLPFTSDQIGANWGTQDYLNNLVNDGFNDVKGEFRYENYRLGVDYALNDSTLLYFTIADGSKMGGFTDGVNIDGIGTIVFFPYEPETVINYELGYKGTLLEGTLNLTAALFHSDFEEKQITVFQKVGEHAVTGRDVESLLTVNAGEARMRGLELEFEWALSANDTISGFVAYLDAQYTEYKNTTGGWFCDERSSLGIDPCAADNEQDYSGNTMPYTPDLALTVSYQHIFDLSNGATIKPFVSVHWEDEAYMHDSNFDAYHKLSSLRDAWYNVDASLRYDSADANWHADLFVTNATDERVINRGRDWQGQVGGSWNNSRFYGVRLGYSL